MANKFNVYRYEMYYGDFSLVAARNAEDANEYVKVYKENSSIAGFWGNNRISENDKIPCLFSEEEGIILCGSSYRF